MVFVFIFLSFKRTLKYPSSSVGPAKSVLVFFFKINMVSRGIYPTELVLKTLTARSHTAKGKLREGNLAQDLGSKVSKLKSRVNYHNRGSNHQNI